MDRREFNKEVDKVSSKYFRDSSKYKIFGIILTAISTVLGFKVYSLYEQHLLPFSWMVAIDVVLVILWWCITSVWIEKRVDVLVDSSKKMAVLEKKQPPVTPEQKRANVIGLILIIIISVAALSYRIYRLSHGFYR